MNSLKRDMETVKSLMLLLESQDDDSRPLKLPEEMDKNEAVYHLKIMEQAGYTKNNIQIASNTPTMIYSSLTWDGQEFLSVLKNEEATKIAETMAKKKGTKLSDLSFEVMKALLIASSKQIFGLN